MFVALSTFGAVNGILLTSSRLFYAGACEGQMPEILTMIQIHRLTPTPAVLIMALLSMVYLTVSDIFALINYVGFATWVSNSMILCVSCIFYNAFLSIAVEYWGGCPLFALAALGSTQPPTPHPSESCLPSCVFISHRICYGCTNDCQPRGDCLRRVDDPFQYSCLSGVHCLQE